MTKLDGRKEKELIEKIIKLVEANKGHLILDEKNPEHQDIARHCSQVGVRSKLAKEHKLVVSHAPDKSVREIHAHGLSSFSSKDKDKPVKVFTQAAHEYIPPYFQDEIYSMFKVAVNHTSEKSVNVMFVGPHGSGKTEMVYFMSPKIGFDRVFQINGREDMDTASFLGDKTVVVDDKTMQNYVSYQRGVIEQAMTHGLEKDENDNVAVDEKTGKVKVVGKPALLFIDEYAAIEPTVNIVLNRLLQIPNHPGQSRVIELDNDGGRKILSHPGFCVVLAGNTLGKGLNSELDQQYTAQDYQQDASTLDRISAVFEFGYNLDAEKKIVISKLGDDSLATKMLEFRNAIRNAYCKRSVETLLSTRLLIGVCDAIRMFKDSGINDAIGKALYRTFFNRVTETEKAAWNEQIKIIFNINIIEKFENSPQMWMPKMKG